jgi:lysophospholipase L1-like esterase
LTFGAPAARPTFRSPTHPALLKFPPVKPRFSLPAVLLAFLTGAPFLPAQTTDAPPTGITNCPAESLFPGEGPTRARFDWFRNLWVERRTAWWRQRTNDQGAVVFLGDSITQGWGSLAKDFPGLKTANRGISGDTTRGVRFRLKEDVLDLAPRAIVLLIGTNDLEEGAPPALIAANVRAILETCRAAAPKAPLILCQVMPSSATKKRPAAQIKDLNTRLAAVAKTIPDCTLVDTWTPFADDQGDARPAEFPDLLHPNAAGYAQFAKALRPAFQQAKLVP